jgi:hypothetical protein
LKTRKISDGTDEGSQGQTNQEETGGKETAAARKGVTEWRSGWFEAGVTSGATGLAAG